MTAETVAREDVRRELGLDELLRRSVSRHDEIFKRYVKDTVQSMRQVDPQMFDDVMALQFDEGSSA